MNRNDIIMEIWKDIIGYEGLYMVSNYGRVKTKERFIIRSNGEPLRVKERIRKLVKRTDGYMEVHLRKDGKGISKKVHRLVAEAFLPNNKKLPCVNHRDENKTNNFVTNLEWCDHYYNNNYGTKNERSAKNRINGKRSKAVLQYTLDFIFIKRWDSLAEIERVTGFSNSNISACCRGKFNKMYGYKWAYE